MKDSQKLFVLSIDGVPYSLVQEAFQKGRMPHFQRLIRQGSLREMNSVLPVISAVAWATFSTGVNPAKHGIFGFTDRDSELRPVVLTASRLMAKSLWRRLNECQKRVVAINVPGTYPPDSIEGILIGDFLSPTVEKATYPASLVPLLKSLNYLVDADPRLAHRDKDAFLGELFQALQSRSKLTFRLLEEEDWDFFMLHIMETDRINHFFWEAKDDPQHPHHSDFWKFYAEVDRLIAAISQALAQDTELMILSDHGFCEIRHEVDLNRYLMDLGYLRYKKGAQGLRDLEPSSLAYSLTPGRIYLNRRGREVIGRVEAADAPPLLDELKDALYQLKDPESDEPIIQRIYAREEIYQGPLLSQAAELIAHPNNGYDLKASIGNEGLFQRTARTGMHTYEEALVCVRGHTLHESAGQQPSILDMAPTIFALMGLTIPSEFEGRNLL